MSKFNFSCITNYEGEEICVFSKKKYSLEEAKAMSVFEGDGQVDTTKHTTVWTKWVLRLPKEDREDDMADGPQYYIYRKKQRSAIECWSIGEDEDE